MLVVKYFTYLKHTALDRLRVRLNVILLVKFSLATVDGRTLTPSVGVIPCEFPDDLHYPETRMILLPDSENRIIVARQNTGM